MIFNQSGGTSLNFKVVKNPQPANPSPNTIWINTDHKINGYSFSATQPESMAEGEVWFAIGAVSDIAFSATKKNPVMVYPLSAKQHIGGALVDVTAKSYQDGEWVDWVPRGTIFDSKFGGAVVPMSVVYKQANATVNITESGIVFTYTTFQSSQSGVITDEAIDLTDYSTLYVEADISGTGQTTSITGRIVVNATQWKADQSSFVAQKAFAANTGRTVYELPVDSLNGLYFIGTAGGVEGTIYKILLE